MGFIRFFVDDFDVFVVLRGASYPLTLLTAGVRYSLVVATPNQHFSQNGKLAGIVVVPAALDHRGFESFATRAETDAVLHFVVVLEVLNILTDGLHEFILAQIVS